MMAIKDNKLIYSDFMGENSLQVNYLDVGARGDIQPPWNLFEAQALKVIGFEPDPIEASRLSQLFPERKYYPNALWGMNARRTFYSCDCEPTSSMYSPNHKLENVYEAKHWSGRWVKKEVEVECSFLDEIIKNEDVPDFIKVDTQGAEYEILSGGVKLLSKNAPLVLAETWCEEVYKGAPLYHDVIKLMYGLGYHIFDYSVAAAWKYQNKDNLDVRSKQRAIGFDCLFVKKTECIGDITRAQFIKLIGLCELYGYRDYSIYLIENTKTLDKKDSAKIKSILYDNSESEKNICNRIKLKLLKSLGFKAEVYPKLHY